MRSPCVDLRYVSLIWYWPSTKIPLRDSILEMNFLIHYFNVKQFEKGFDEIKKPHMFVG